MTWREPGTNRSFFFDFSIPVLNENFSLWERKENSLCAEYRAHCVVLCVYIFFVIYTYEQWEFLLTTLTNEGLASLDPTELWRRKFHSSCRFTRFSFLNSTTGTLSACLFYIFHLGKKNNKWKQIYANFVERSVLFRRTGIRNYFTKRYLGKKLFAISKIGFPSKKKNYSLFSKLIIPQKIELLFPKNTNCHNFTNTISNLRNYFELLF